MACALLAWAGALLCPGPGGHGLAGPGLVKDVADLGFKGVGPAAVLSTAGPAALWFKVGGLVAGGARCPGPVRTGACLRARNGLGWLGRRLVKDVACKTSGGFKVGGPCCGFRGSVCRPRV